MHRWERSQSRIGVSAPSWLTFEVHRPYFDGESTARTAIQARGPLVAAALFIARDPLTPRFGMVMPASFRQLLIEESRLFAYGVTRPTDLAPELASPNWRALADAYRDRDCLDETDRAGLAQWLVAAALPEAMLELAPTDRAPADCRDVLPALVQYARATALFQREGLSAATRAAYAPLVQAPQPTLAHLQACAGWGQLLARHASDPTDAARFAKYAFGILRELAPDLPGFDRGIWLARLLLREAMVAERDGNLDAAWEQLDQARHAYTESQPATPEQDEIAAEMWRRILDRRVEIAVKRGDRDSEERTIDEGLKLDPYCVKIRMQAAQTAQRRGDLARALSEYLIAARLGPYGTAFALLQAAGCAQRLGHDEFARVLTERAFRVAPRSEQTHTALVRMTEGAGDTSLAKVLRPAADGYRNNWYYRMYGAYFNLGESGSPCLYAALPTMAYEFAAASEYPRLDAQRIMPPAFRTNLVRESGLVEFAVRRPEELPAGLRTPQWDQLSEWVSQFERGDLLRQHLTCLVLFRLGLRDLILELVPQRPVASLREPLEFHHYCLRDIARYSSSVGGRTPMPPSDTFAMVDHPDCPLLLRLTASTFGVVFAARETKSVADAVRWRARAAEYLDAVLASDEFTSFEKVMLESRFYRGVGFVPFMNGDRDGTIADMARAEELARAVPATTTREQFLARENLHACLESRSKEAFGLRDVALGHARTEEFLALDPYDPKSHIELAESLNRQERFAEAGESYLRAARLAPLGTALAYAMAGGSFERAGAAVVAEDCFVQALRVDPYAVSAARGWPRVASNGMGALAREYAEQLEEWGAARLPTR
jgi:tetratricopeptide (TPR) repeat protein